MFNKILIIKTFLDLYLIISIKLIKEILKVKA